MDQEKLSKFKQAVFSDVEAKIEEIEKEAAEIKKASLAQTEEEQLNDAYSYIQTNVAKIKNEYRLLVAKKELAVSQELLLKRECFRRQMLERIRTRLSDFAKTEDYKTFLLDRLAFVLQSHSLEHSAFLYRAEDAWLEAEVKAKFPVGGCAFEVSDSVELGGFIIRNEENGYIIDETLESKLEEQIPYFNQNCRIAVE